MQSVLMPVSKTSFTKTKYTHTVTNTAIAAGNMMPAQKTMVTASLSKVQESKSIRSLAHTGEQDILSRVQTLQIEAVDENEPRQQRKELSPDEIVKLLEDIEKDPLKRELLRDKISIYQSFFERVTEGRFRVKPGKNWAYSPNEETLIYPVRDILNTELDELVGLGIHEGMHRYGTRYTDFMPFLDKLTGLLFNSAEDVAIENWAVYLVQGADKYFQKMYKDMDSKEWLEDHFGKDIPEHIQFIFGILYYGKRGQLPAVLEGEARDALETNEIQQALNEVFNALPMMRDEQGNLSINKDPTPMEILAAAKLRVEIMRDKVLPVYKKLLAQRAEKLSKGQYKLAPDKEGAAGDQIDLDSLPEGTRKELEKEIEKYARELGDKTKEGSKSWQDTQKAKRDKQKQGQSQKKLAEADKLADQRHKRGEEGRRLSDAEKFARIKALEGGIKSSFNSYQLNLDMVKRLVHNLTGQMANIIREDTKPKWQGGLRRGKEIEWDRFFISSMSGFTDDRYWIDRTVPTKRDMKFTLVIDESSSMSGSRGENALLACLVFMDVLQNLGIDFNVRGFGDNTYLHKGFRNQIEDGIRRNYDTIKERNELIEELSSSMATGGATADGDALYAAVEDVRNYGSEKNIVLLLTDGEGNQGMPLDDAMKHAQDLGIKVIGIGIGEGISYVAENYEHHLQVPNIDVLPLEFKRLLKKEIESMSVGSTGRAARSSSAGTAVSATKSVMMRAKTLNSIDQAS